MFSITSRVRILRPCSGFAAALNLSPAMYGPAKAGPLLIQNEPVRDHDDRVENLAILRVMQAGEPVGEPRDAVALAASGRVPDQIILTGPRRPCVGDELANRIDLVVTGKDERFLFSLLFDVEKAAEKKGKEESLIFP